jgi:hypothetical protein
VTGATGYVASWIVRYLVEDGYVVRGTVRDPGKAKGLEHLHALAAAPVAGFTREFVERNVGHPIEFDNSRSLAELGLTYRDPADTVSDQFQQMIDDGLVHKPIGR